MMPKSAQATVAHVLAHSIREWVHGEDGLIERARVLRNGDPAVPLAQEETLEMVGNILWEAHAGDMAHAARICGAITAYFLLARTLEIELPDEISDLKPWGRAVYPLSRHSLSPRPD